MPDAIPSGIFSFCAPGRIPGAVQQQPIPMRAHMVLCLLGYRGEGYSVTFVSAMSRLHRTLFEDPDRLVRLVTSPDPICHACVNLRNGGCTLGGEDHEAHMRAQDEDVLARLGLALDGVYPWRTIRNRIRLSVRGTDLPDICTTCPWLDLGFCAEGIEALRAQAPEPT